MLTLLDNFNKVLSNHFLSYMTLHQLQVKIITLKAIKSTCGIYTFLHKWPKLLLSKKTPNKQKNTQRKTPHANF